MNCLKRSTANCSYSQAIVDHLLQNMDKLQLTLYATAENKKDFYRSGLFSIVNIRQTYVIQDFVTKNDLFNAILLFTKTFYSSTEY